MPNPVRPIFTVEILTQGPELISTYDKFQLHEF